MRTRTTAPALPWTPRGCRRAAKPPTSRQYVVGFIEAVKDRGTIPTTYLNTLGVRALAKVEEAVSDHVAGLGQRLGELDHQVAQAA